MYDLPNQGHVSLFALFERFPIPVSSWETPSQLGSHSLYPEYALSSSLLGIESSAEELGVERMLLNCLC